MTLDTLIIEFDKGCVPCWRRRRVRGPLARPRFERTSVMA